jgi:hypothetical protein
MRALVAHAPQVVHQREGGIVTNDEPVGVGDGKRQTRALQQCAEIAQIGKRRHARRDAAFDFAFRRGEGLPQLVERLAAEEGGEKQPVGFEHAAYLDERTRQVVDQLQRQGRNDEIERAVREWQRLLVGDDQRAGAPRANTRRRGGRDDRPDRAETGQRRAHRFGGCAEIKRKREAPQHQGDPIGEIAGDVIDEKRRRLHRRRTPAAGTDEGAIEYQRAIGHGRIVSRPRRGVLAAASGDDKGPARR